MASIITDAQQIKACEQVNSDIAEIKMINHFLKNGNEYRLSINDRKKEWLIIDSDMNDKMTAILKKQKEKLVKNIQRLTLKFRIQLDDADLNEMKEKESVIDGDSDNIVSCQCVCETDNSELI